MNIRIILATTNQGKFAELSAMLDLPPRLPTRVGAAGMGIDWVSLRDFRNTSPPVEDGETFADNARKKALGYAKQTGLWTLADDSGLVIDALAGEPGVKSARFSGLESGDRKTTDQKNIEKVLKLLQDVPAEKKTARFICCLCLAEPEKVVLETTGELEGIIAQRAAGRGGFGYDPIFFVPKLKKTVAQLSDEQKNAISHRSNAVGKLRPLLEEILHKTHA